jgi:hypothetical protein
MESRRALRRPARPTALASLLGALLVTALPARAQDVPPAGAPESVPPATSAPPAPSPAPTSPQSPTSPAPGSPAGRDAPPAKVPDASAPGADATDAAGAQAVDLTSLALQPGEVARIGGLAVLRDDDLDLYLGTIYARMPEGDAALQQLTGEALIEHDAAAAGLVATEADVDASLASLDQEARKAAGNNGKGFEESVQAKVSKAQMRDAVRLLVLHERLVRAADGLPPDAPVLPDLMKEWLDHRIELANIQAATLDDPLAAVFDGGSLTKVQVGARIRSLLAPDALTGVLTELIGIQLVRARAALLGVDLTTAACTREILDRNAILKTQPGAGDVSYEQFVQMVQKRSMKELLTSDKFSTEVLLRLITERTFTDAQARSFWEMNKPAFQAASKGKLGADADWDAARPFVWRELRQRTYRALFEQSRIARRF